MKPKIEGRGKRERLFTILTIPSEPALPWKLPHLYKYEMQQISESQYFFLQPSVTV